MSDPTGSRAPSDPSIWQPSSLPDPKAPDTIKTPSTKTPSTDPNAKTEEASSKAINLLTQTLSQFTSPSDASKPSYIPPSIATDPQQRTYTAATGAWVTANKSESDKLISLSGSDAPKTAFDVKNLNSQTTTQRNQIEIKEHSSQNDATPLDPRTVEGKKDLINLLTNQDNPKKPVLDLQFDTVMKRVALTFKGNEKEGKELSRNELYWNVTSSIFNALRHYHSTHDQFMHFATYTDNLAERHSNKVTEIVKQAILENRELTREELNTFQSSLEFYSLKTVESLAKELKLAKKAGRVITEQLSKIDTPFFNNLSKELQEANKKLENAAIKLKNETAQKQIKVKLENIGIGVTGDWDENGVLMQVEGQNMYVNEDSLKKALGYSKISLFYSLSSTARVSAKLNNLIKSTEKQQDFSDNNIKLRLQDREWDEALTALKESPLGKNKTKEALHNLLLYTYMPKSSPNRNDLHEFLKGKQEDYSDSLIKMHLGRGEFGKAIAVLRDSPMNKNKSEAELSEILKSRLPDDPQVKTAFDKFFLNDKTAKPQEIFRERISAATQKLLSAEPNFDSLNKTLGELHPNSMEHVWSGLSEGQRETLIKTFQDGITVNKLPEEKRTFNQQFLLNKVNEFNEKVNAALGKVSPSSQQTTQAEPITSYFEPVLTPKQVADEFIKLCRVDPKFTKALDFLEGSKESLRSDEKADKEFRKMLIDNIITNLNKDAEKLISPIIARDMGILAYELNGALHPVDNLIKEQLGKQEFDKAREILRNSSRGRGLNDEELNSIIRNTLSEGFDNFIRTKVKPSVAANPPAPASSQLEVKRNAAGKPVTPPPAAEESELP